jgi:hypothetical protein
MSIANQPVGTRERAASRRVQVLELRKAGASMRAIARQLHISVSTAHKDLWLALDELAAAQREKAEPLRQLELERLDRYLLALEPTISRGEPRAILAAVRIMERRARLLGLDAAQLPEQPPDVSTFLAALAGHGHGNGERRQVYDA